MTAHEEKQDDRDDLELDPETVKDLEPSEADADQIPGGAQSSSNWGGDSSM